MYFLLEMTSSDNTQPISTSIRVFPLRLSPNKDVLTSIRTLMTKGGLRSVYIMTCVGSVKACRLRMANSHDVIDLKAPHEIVSLVGTIDSEAQHIHGSFSDGTGRVVGGHVMPDYPMTVYTTVEIVLAECEDVIFSREMDDESGYPELVITKKH
jgi:predicted DNA-binding protein with PD1-like motif